MEQSHGSTNANQNDSFLSGNIREGEELKKSKPIINTPFVAQWTEVTGWFAVCGKYRLTEYFETEDELIQHVNEKPWDMILAVINIVNIEGTKLIENELNNN